METAPHRLELRSKDSLVRRLFGLPFLIIGLVAGGAMIRNFGFGAEGFQPFGVLFGVVWGGAFVVGGAWLSLGQRGASFDKRTNEVTLWKGLLVPMFKRKLSLEQVTAVTLVSQVRGSGKHKRTVYVASLGYANNAEAELIAPHDPIFARREAEKVAAFLNVSMRDSTSGTLIVREAQHLNESVRLRYRRLELQAPSVERPSSIVSEISEKEGVLSIYIPATLSHVTIRLAVIILAAGLFAAFFAAAASSKNFGNGFVPFIIVAIIVSLTQLNAFQRLELHLSPTKLDILGKHPFSRFRRSIYREAIEEFELIEPPPGMPQFMRFFQKGIVIRTDELQLSLGSQLQPEEIRFVFATLLKALIR